MAHKPRGTDSFGELNRNTRSKSPQRTISPTPQQPHPGQKLYKDAGIHSITKTNSSALLKKKSLKRIKPISPLIGKSPSSSYLIKNAKFSGPTQKKPSIKMIDSHFPLGQNNSSVSYRSVTPTRFVESVSDNELDTSKSKKKPMSFAMMVEKYEMYKNIFEEIIQKDKTFTVILKKIKESYEEFYEASISEHTQKLKDKIDVLTDAVTKKNEELLTLDKRVRKLSSENYELARSLERSEEICNGIQDRLNKISKFSMESVTKDEQTWKALIIENEAYSISFKNLEAKLNASKKNEKRLKQLILDIKKSGFPIEEFYEKNFPKEKSSSIQKKPLTSETSESDCLVSQRLPDAIKPSQVPDLDLNQVEPESITSSNTFSDLYDLS